MIQKKQEFYTKRDMIYYPIESSSYKLDIIFSFIWNIGLFGLTIYLIINHSIWWLLLFLFINSPDKIASKDLDA